MNCKEKKSYWQQAIRAKDYWKAILIGVGMLIGISYLFYESWIAFLFLSPLLVVWMKLWEKEFILKMQSRFQIQFKDAIQSAMSSMSVGYSAENAWKEAEKEVKVICGEKEVISREFGQMRRQLEMNVPLETILAEFAERTGDEEVQNFATAFVMARKSGGNLINIMRTAGARIIEKIETKREMEMTIASKKLEFRVMSMIPFGMIFFMKISFGEFFDILYGNAIGGIIMTGCLALYTVGFWLGQKMIRFEV